MKRVFGLLLTGMVLMTACSKRTRPTTSVPVRSKTINRPAPAPPASSPEVYNAPPAITPAPPAVVLAPMIVIDEKGAVITPREKLPADIGPKVDYGKIGRGYTPAQRQNLIYRFKMVPPRVLFVPDQLASHNGRGSYVIYKKKFWYWKKADGLFHIDETYYL
jgi:hypothetical protein